MSDGYKAASEEVKKILAEQASIDEQMILLLDRMNEIPPINLDAWIESIASTDGYAFTIGDYSEMFKIGRHYKKLAEQREKNEHRLKAAMIEEVIQKIKCILPDDGGTK